MKQNIFFLGLLILSFAISSCDKDESIIESSESQTNALDIEQRSDSTCCDYTLDIQVVDSNPRCCTYRILITNNGDCRMALFDSNNRRYMVIGSKKSNYVTVRRCVWEEGPLSFRIMSGNEVCDTFVLDASCEVDHQECCEFSYQAFFVGIIGGCCRYEVIVNNPTDCEIFLFTENGVVHTFPANGGGQLMMNRCPWDIDLKEVHYLGYSKDKDYACATFELTGCTSKD